MIKSVAGILAGVSLLAGCAAPPSAQPQASNGQSSAPAASLNSAPADSDEDYDTIYVPPPVGSHLGGGMVRVAKKSITGDDEKALLGNIRRLNAAAGSNDERPYVVAAVSRVTGVGVRDLQAQQDALRLRFGELCAINAIAKGNTAKAKEIAMQKSSGRTWTQLASANGLRIAAVAETARNANDLTVSSYTNAAERAKGGQQKLKSMGVRPQVRPGT